MNLFCDSSIHEACVVLPNEEPLLFQYPDVVTGNVGEYRAVLIALRSAHQGDVVLSDSLLVVNQVNGKWKCKAEHLLPYRDGVRLLLEKNGVELRWVPREKNLAGIVLEGR